MGDGLVIWPPFPHNKDAARVLAKVKSKGVATQIHEVTVEGTEYWRVPLPGFSTAAEAKVDPGSIKETLELRAVWAVMRCASR
jgi:hypothetical protein